MHLRRFVVEDAGYGSVGRLEEGSGQLPKATVLGSTGWNAPAVPPSHDPWRWFQETRDILV